MPSCPESAGKYSTPPHGMGGQYGRPPTGMLLECSVEQGLIDRTAILGGTAALGCVEQFTPPRAAVPHIKARLAEH